MSLVAKLAGQFDLPFDPADLASLDELAATGCPIAVPADQVMRELRARTVDDASALVKVLNDPAAIETVLHTERRVTVRYALAANRHLPLAVRRELTAWIASRRVDSASVYAQINASSGLPGQERLDLLVNVRAGGRVGKVCLDALKAATIDAAASVGTPEAFEVVATTVPYGSARPLAQALVDGRFEGLTVAQIARPRAVSDGQLRAQLVEVAVELLHNADDRQLWRDALASPWPGLHTAVGELVADGVGPSPDELIELMADRPSRTVLDVLAAADRVQFGVDAVRQLVEWATTGSNTPVGMIPTLRDGLLARADADAAVWMLERSGSSSDGWLRERAWSCGMLPVDVRRTWLTNAPLDVLSNVARWFTLADVAQIAARGDLSTSTLYTWTVEACDRTDDTLPAALLEVLLADADVASELVSAPVICTSLGTDGVMRILADDVHGPNLARRLRTSGEIDPAVRVAVIRRLAASSASLVGWLDAHATGTPHPLGPLDTATLTATGRWLTKDAVCWAGEAGDRPGDRQVAALLARHVPAIAGAQLEGPLLRWLHEQATARLTAEGYKLAVGLADGWAGTLEQLIETAAALQSDEPAAARGGVTIPA